MSNEVDFEQFIKLLDGALASDDKNVKQALRKFLFVTAMVLGDDCEPGPFSKMIETMDSMQRRLAMLEANNTNTVTTTDWTGMSPPYTVGGTGVAYPFISPTTTPGGSAAVTPLNWTNAVSTTTTASTTGNITLVGLTNTSGNVTLGSGSASTFTVTPAISSGTTTLNYWINSDNPETGTEIKNDIMEALDRLASTA